MGGKLDGYVGGKKLKPREEWVIHEDTHEPLVSVEIAEVIRQIKKSGLRDAPVNRKLYALSGILKCDICGAPFVGNAGYYRCNNKVEGVRACSNNSISQGRAEEVVFTLLGEHILKYKNIRPVIETVKQKLNDGGGTQQMHSLERRLKQIGTERERLLAAYQLGLVELDEVESKLAELNDDKYAIEENIEALRSQQGAVKVNDEEIRFVIETLGEQVKHSDPKVRKQAALTLFEELKIGPKTGSQGVRNITAKGICLPLPGVFMASPRGFEPLLPA